MKMNYLYPYLKWHNLKSEPNDLPKTTAWYVYKVRSSDDYRITYGYEKITSNNADYWARIPTPFEVNHDTCNDSARRDMELSRKTHCEF